MAAGLGYKEFTTGDVLTAADANGYLASQVVMVFADSAARTTAITSPQEGMISYLKDTNATQYYSGSAWVTIGGSASPLTTKGDLYTYSTADARLAVGTNGQILTADSTAATGLKWATAAGGGGKVLQVVSATTTTTVTNSTTTYSDTTLTCNITPSSATSKVLVMISQNGGQKTAGNAGNGLDIQAYRGATSLGYLTTAAAYTNTAVIFTGMSFSFIYLDSPATTSALTYKTQMRNRVVQASVSIQEGNETSSIVLMEIGA